MTRTRFRPSANGPLHFGGAYVARQNWRFARAKGGEFILLIDDVVPVFKYGASAALTKRMREHAENFRRDLDWLGWGPDAMHYASEFAEAHREGVKRLGVTTPAFGEMACLQRYVHNPDAGTTTTYHPWLTVGRVTDDHELHVSEFVRGGDIYAEVQLYDYFAEALYGANYHVMQAYMDIIVEPAGEAVCSKSNGTTGIAAYREAGVTAAQIEEALANLKELPPLYGNITSHYRQVDEKYLRVPKPKPKPKRRR